MAFLRLMLEYLTINLKISWAYKESFLSQVIGMIINDGIWVVFWILFFNRFPVMNGWHIDDLMLMWAVITFAYGIAAGLFGNCRFIPKLAVEGQLDQFMVMPKPVLLQIICSQIRLINIGDVFFGPMLLFFFVKVTGMTLLLYLVSAMLASIIFLAVFITIGSLVFYLGNSETVSGTAENLFMIFTSYPSMIFDRVVKAVLYTLVPAAFISTMPVEIIQRFSWENLVILILAASGYLTFAIWFFYNGLKRYESGNLIMMRR